MMGRLLRLAGVLGVLTLLLGFIAGCGGGDGGEGTTSPQVTTNPKPKEPAPEPPVEPPPGKFTPKNGETELAKVYKKPQKGIPADLGQWMLDIEVDPGGKLRFSQSKLVAPPGNTNFRLINPTKKGHDLTIREVGAGSVSTPVIRKGSAWVRASLFSEKRFVFYCSIPGHREAGMEGLIEIKTNLGEEDLKPF